MRQNQFSDWLTNFTDESCKKVEASYLDALKQMIEHKSKQKYGTIDDALNDFCARMNIDRIATDTIKSAAFDNNKFQAVLASLKLAIDVKEIEKEIGRGTPAEAVANEHGNNSEEKSAIKEYVESKKQDQRDQNSQIVRDMGRSEDQKVTPTSTPSLPKMSSLRGLSRVK